MVVNLSFTINDNKPVYDPLDLRTLAGWSLGIGLLGFLLILQVFM